MTIQTTFAPTSCTQRISVTRFLTTILLERSLWTTRTWISYVWHSIMDTYVRSCINCYLNILYIFLSFSFRFLPVVLFRRSNRAPPNAYRRQYVTGDDFRIISELSTGLAARGSPLTSEAESFELLRETNKKPPGLTQEALDRLPLEIFGSLEVDVERKKSRESRDCGICLESFGEGDLLTRLPCGHRFHFACLDPWLRTCGDCPYCRSIL